MECSRSWSIMVSSTGFAGGSSPLLVASNPTGAPWRRLTRIVAADDRPAWPARAYSKVTSNRPHPPESGFHANDPGPSTESPLDVRSTGNAREYQHVETRRRCQHNGGPVHATVVRPDDCPAMAQTGRIVSFNKSVFRIVKATNRIEPLYRLTCFNRQRESWGMLE